MNYLNEKINLAAGRYVAYIIDAAAALVLLFVFMKSLFSFPEILGQFLKLDKVTFSLFLGSAELLFFFIINILPVTVYGKSLGQKIMHIAVVTNTGHKVSFFQAIVLFVSFVLVSGLLTLGAGILMIIFRKDSRGLHNIISGTKVIRDPTKK